MGKYDNFTKEELIKLLLDFEGKRAFSYEDQLKLTILDKSPFTIWASDRNCIIKMWSGQCESMYGRRKEDVIGKDFVDLFVAPDEKAAARRDQLEIIDNEKEFHNIANDQGRNGNTLKLITNCFRIQDPETGEFWNAEMGVAIDYYEEEQKQLERNIEEGRLIQTLLTDFSETQNQYREQFFNRRASLDAAIRTGRLEAFKQQKTDQYTKSTQEIEQKIKEINHRIEEVNDEYAEKIKLCSSSLACVRMKNEYISVLRDVLIEFDNLVIDFEIISFELTNQSGVLRLRDEIMKATTANNTRLESFAQEVWLEATVAVKEYTELGTHIDTASPRLTQLKEQRDKVKELKDKIHIIADDIYSQLSNATTEDALNEIKTSMEKRYKEIEARLQKLREG